MFLKFIAKATEYYFYLCIFIGLSASTLICFAFLLNCWNRFVNSKNNFLEWLKTWKCKEFIKKRYEFALFSENLFEDALKQIKDETMQRVIKNKWEELKKHAE
jgi:hypothetical protein